MLSIGVVGLGYWGPNLVRNISASPRTTLAAICDADQDRLTTLADQYPSAQPFSDAEKLFEDPSVEAVVIATPVATHHALAKSALLSGKHVIVEKPLTASAAAGQDLIETAARMQRVLMVDHIFLFSPAVQRLVATARSGALGELQYIDSVRINLGLIQSDVNVVWDLAPHDLSIMDLLVDRSPKSVMVVGSSHASNGIIDVAHLHVDYGEDLRASVHVNWLSPVKIRHFLIGGTRRSVLYNDLDRSEPIKVYDRGIDVGPDPDGKRDLLVSYRSGDVVSPRVEPNEPLRNMLEHFVDVVRNGHAPISSAAQGLRLVRVLEAADESIRLGGRRVEVA